MKKQKYTSFLRKFLCPKKTSRNDKHQRCFLSAKFTTKLQPLDQGIIENFKIHYKSTMLDYVVQSLGDELEKKFDLKIAVYLIVSYKK